MAAEWPKMNHDRLWAAIDALASRHGLTPSGLARRAGLDATAFNKSKRFTGDGRPRWPSTESIAKILTATGTDLDDLARLIDDADRVPVQAVPSFLTADGAPPGFRDDQGGENDGAATWGPSGALEAMRVDGASMLPLYRPGDVLIVSGAAPIRPGDRVVVRVDGGPPQARVFLRHDGDTVEVGQFPAGEPRERISSALLTRLVRIVWVSQ